MPTPRRIDHYELIEEIGRGAQGQVFLAQDTRLGRRVALKVLSSTFSASSGAVRRFEREATIASRLDHPGICPIYEAGEWQGQHYIAMRYLEGETLAHKISSSLNQGAESGSETIGVGLPGAPGSAGPTQPGGETVDAGARGSPPSPPAQGGSDSVATVVSYVSPMSRTEISRILACIERVARALHAAHEVGLIHRDVKPGNIMVTAQGEPVILDFGLARDEEEGHSLTLSGDLLGTPAYMSPEQLLAQRITLDRRTDVYSLGVTLYECLTLRRPYEASTREALYQRILAADLPDPTRLNRSIPKDLKVVLATALERDRERRYKTALEFAEDLRRIRCYEPIQARPAGPLLRFRRWVQRNPVVATVTVGVMLLLLTALTITAVLLRDVEQQRSIADVNAKEAKEALLLVEQKSKELEGTLTRLETESELRERALQDLSASVRRSEGLTLAAQASGALSYNPGLALLLGLQAAQLQDTVILRDTLVEILIRNRERRVLGSSRGLQSASVFSPGATRFLACNVSGGRTRVLDTSTWLPVALLGSQPFGPVAAVFSPDGKRIVFRHWGLVDADIWDVDSGKPLAAVRVEGSHIESVAFDAKGERVAVGTHDAKVKVFEAATGREVAFFDAQLEDSFQRVLFTPDGEKVIACSEGVKRFYTLSPDGTVRSSGVTSSDRSTEAFLIDARTGEKLEELTGHRGGVEAAVSPDGKLLFIGSQGQRSCRIWSFVTGALQAEPEVPLDHPGLVRFSPDSMRLLVTSRGGNECHVLDVSTGAETARLRGHRNSILAAEWSADGASILTGSQDTTARLWDSGTGAQVAAFEGHEAGVFAVAFGPQAEEAFTASGDGTLRVWDASRTQRFGLVPLPTAEPAWQTQVSHDGATVAILSEGGLRLYNTETGAELGKIVTTRAAGFLAALGLGSAVQRIDLVRFSPDCHRLLVSGWSTGVFWEVWSIEPFQRISRWKPAESTTWTQLFGELSGDGSIAAVSALQRVPRRGEPQGFLNFGGGYSFERRVELRDVASGNLLTAVEVHGDSVRSLEFSADGTRLLCFLGSSGIKVLDVASGKEVCNLGQLPSGGIQGATLSPGGRMVACSDWSSSVALIDVDSNTVTATLGDHVGRVEGMVFSKDSSRLVTFASDRSATLWDTSSGERLLTLRGHLAAVKVTAFSDDRLLLLTGSEDQRVKVWSLEPGPAFGEEVITFPHDEAITSASFDPEARHVVSVSSSGKVYRWPLDIVSEARRRKTRDLTAAEYERFHIGSEEERKGFRVRTKLASIVEDLDATEALLRGPESLEAVSTDIWRSLDDLATVVAEAPADPQAQEVLARMSALLQRVWGALPLGEPKVRASCEVLAGLFSKCGQHREAAEVLEKGQRLSWSPNALEPALAREREALGADLPSYASIDAALDQEEVLVAAGAQWRFLRGRAEPSEGLEWTGLEFDDEAWESGPTGIGYGDGDDATILSDMRDGYTTLYLRREVVLPRRERYSRFTLTLTVDDGVVAYVNSVEVGRFLAGPPGERIPFTGTAETEAIEPIAPVEVRIPPEILRDGKNTIALQVLNRSLTSSDLSCIPVLSATPRAEPERDQERLAAFRAVAAGDDAGLRVSYFEGRVKERAGAFPEAAAIFERLLGEERVRPEPYLALARCRLALATPPAAERALRQAIDEGLQGGLPLWEAWYESAAAQLRWPPQRLLASWPRPSGPRGVGRGFGLLFEDVVRSLQAKETLRIRCGGDSLTDSTGQVWRSDMFYVGGTLGAVAGGRPLQNSQDAALYMRHRYFGEVRVGSQLPGYRIPVLPGAYKVTLHFAEVYHRGGGRKFNVLLEGKRVLEGYDAFSVGFFTVDQRSFDVDVAGAFLTIEFERISGNPMVSGIEVAPVKG